MSDRKYRQRGYQETGDRERGRKGPPRPKQRREGPRGRGLGTPTATVFRCAVCGHKQPAPEVDAFDAVCAKCGTDLRTCTHCVHFDTSAPRECRKPVPERITGKAKRNRCELFEPKAAKEFGQDKMSPDEARAAFDALFKI